MKNKNNGSLIARIYLIIVAAKKLCFSSLYCSLVVALISHLKNILILKNNDTVTNTNI
jgi:hypothetical protein